MSASASDRQRRWPSPLGRRLLVLWVACIAAASAATELEVVVKSRDGGDPVAGAIVQIGAASDEARLRASARRFAATDDKGRIVFEGLEAGTYQVDVRVNGSDLVSPNNNPQAPPPVVTLEEGESRSVVIELWRGTWVDVTTSWTGWSEAGFAARFESLDSGQVLPLALGHRQAAGRRLLAPGLWRLSVEAPSGFLLDEVLRDGQPLAGHTVTLDLNAEPFETVFHYGYRVEARLDGRVASDKGTPGLVLEATLLEPGPWYEAAQARGGSQFQTVRRSAIPLTEQYELPLPSGRWRVEPKADLPIQSEPPFIEIDLLAGQAELVEFSVETSVSPEALLVFVSSELAESAPRRGIDGAIVEVYQGDDLVDSRQTDGIGRARIYGLVPDGVYRVVAGHVDTLDATATVRYDPRFLRAQPTPSDEVARGKSVALRLPVGAGFEFEAVDMADHPLGEVVIDIVRLPDSERRSLDGSELRSDGVADAPRTDAEAQRLLEEVLTEEVPEAQLRSSEYRTQKLLRQVTTDQRGRGRALGFYTGRYRIKARLGGGDDALGQVLLSSREDDLAPSLELELEKDEVARVEATLVPAARVAARLSCDDGGGLPAVVDVEIYRAVVSEGEVTLSKWDEEPVVSLYDRPLSARENRVVAGPLDVGVFEVAIRPEGFERWTWAFETQDRSRALPIRIDRAQVVQGEELDLGLFVVACEPVVEIGLDSVGLNLRKEPLEFRATLHDRELEARGGALVELPPPRARRTASGVELRRLATGPTRLELEIGNRYLLPDGSYRLGLDLELERGGYVKESVTLEAGGGIIVEASEDGQSFAVDPLSENAGEGWLFQDVAGRRWLGPFPAGRYRVSRCRDSECAVTDGPGRDVEVAAGKDIEMD